MSSAPANKRRRFDADDTSKKASAAADAREAATNKDDGGDDGDDEVLLDDVLVDEDGNFITEDQLREREAEQRRKLRRQRLANVQTAPDHPRDTNNEKATGKMEVEDRSSAGTKQQRQQKSKSKKTRQQQSGGADADNENSGTASAAAKKKDADDEKQDAEKDDDDDMFDMFSSSVSPLSQADNTATDRQNTSTATSATAKRGHEQQDWDDEEGYYKAMIGEMINLDNTNLSAAAAAAAGSDDNNSSKNNTAIQFRVSGVIGKGVFSSVVKCTTISNASSIGLPPVVAMKLIRHNETMAKAAATEIRHLQRLTGSPGIIPLLLPTHAAHQSNKTNNNSNAPAFSTALSVEHRGHVLLVFPYMEYNLRDVLQKFGKGVGLSLTAVRSYFGQLLAALTHLKKAGITHADLKPDNILVSADFSIVQLADFGSAVDADSPEQNQPTPYLVSRFYRAPEIILGLRPTIAIDLWSLAVSVGELFLGDVVFKGKSNNEMLYQFMQHLQPFSNRMIRQHLVQCQRAPIARHFVQDKTVYYFMQQTTDPVTGEPVHKDLSLLPGSNGNTKFPGATPLNRKIVKARSAKDSRTMVSQFSDLLQKCLALDPTRRIALKDALKHEFFQEPSTATTTTANTSSKK